ncbi:hypothetical protein [Brevibacterium ravenspurgense]|uniref:hypothetical protein n=1 Tax=Brevibacterium ravenspurgense TaxID=479117 RepID=UPI001C61115B|nr:hypothetical protein [Brevibacterium ravenspurgense]
MANERSTDQFVRDILRDIGFTRPWEQSINDAPAYIYEAMEGASKGQGSGRGKPDFVVESGEFIVVIEDKPRADQIVKTADATGDVLLRAFRQQEVQDRLGSISPASLDRLLLSGQLAEVSGSEGQASER